MIHHLNFVFPHSENKGDCVMKRLVLFVLVIFIVFIFSNMCEEMYIKFQPRPTPTPVVTTYPKSGYGGLCVVDEMCWPLQYCNPDSYTCTYRKVGPGEKCADNLQCNLVNNEYCASDTTYNQVQQKLNNGKIYRDCQPQYAWETNCTCKTIPPKQSSW